MDKFVVLRIAGKQYKVSEGEEFLVDKLKDTKKFETEVLLYSDGENVEVGKPTLDKIKVSLKVVSDVEKGEKITVFKYKAKSRERRKVGFRPKYTKLLVEKISN